MGVHTVVLFSGRIACGRGQVYDDAAGCERIAVRGGIEQVASNDIATLRRLAFQFSGSIERDHVRAGSCKSLQQTSSDESSATGDEDAPHVLAPSSLRTKAFATYYRDVDLIRRILAAEGDRLPGLARVSDYGRGRRRTVDGVQADPPPGPLDSDFAGSAVSDLESPDGRARHCRPGRGGSGETSVRLRQPGTDVSHRRGQLQGSRRRGRTARR